MTIGLIRNGGMDSLEKQFDPRKGGGGYSDIFIHT